MKKFLWFDLYDGVHAYAAISLMFVCLVPIISLMQFTTYMEAQAMVDNLLNRHRKDLNFSNYMANARQTANTEDMDLSHLFNENFRQNQNTVPPKKIMMITFAITISCEIAGVLVHAALAYGTYKKIRGWLLPYLILAAIVFVILIILIIYAINMTRLYGLTFLFVLLAWAIYPWVAVLNLFQVMPKYLEAGLSQTA